MATTKNFQLEFLNAVLPQLSESQLCYYSRKPNSTKFLQPTIVVNKHNQINELTVNQPEALFTHPN